MGLVIPKVIKSHMHVHELTKFNSYAEVESGTSGIVCVDRFECDGKRSQGGGCVGVCNIFGLEDSMHGVVWVCAICNYTLCPHCALLESGLCWWEAPKQCLGLQIFQCVELNDIKRLEYFIQKAKEQESASETRTNGGGCYYSAFNWPNPNPRDSTAAHLACMNGFADALRLLAAVPGIDLNLLDDSKKTCFRLALDNGHAACIEILASLPYLAAAVGLGRPGELGSQLCHDCDKNALIRACCQGHTQCVAALLTIPEIDVNAWPVSFADGREDSFSGTALYCACLNHNFDCAYLLLAHPSIDVTRGQPPQGHEGKKRIDIHIVTEQSPLHALIESFSVVKDGDGNGNGNGNGDGDGDGDGDGGRGLSKGYDDEAKDDCDMRVKAKRIVKFQRLAAALIEKDRDLINRTDSWGRTPFFTACESIPNEYCKSSDILSWVKFLYNHANSGGGERGGAQELELFLGRRQQHPRNWTVLHTLASDPHGKRTEVLRYLCSLSAVEPPSLSTETERATASTTATTATTAATRPMLLDPNAYDKEGRTPLMLSICSGSLEALKLLGTIPGTDPNTLSPSSLENPLSLALSDKYSRSKKFVQAILSIRGVDVNTPCGPGLQTPCHLALLNAQDLSIFKLLLAVPGVDLNKRSGKSGECHSLLTLARGVSNASANPIIRGKLPYCCAYCYNHSNKLWMSVSKRRRTICWLLAAGATDDDDIDYELNEHLDLGSGSDSDTSDSKSRNSSDGEDEEEDEEEGDEEEEEEEG